MTVKVKFESDDGWKLKDMIRKKGADILRTAAASYLEKLKTGTINIAADC